MTETNVKEQMWHERFLKIAQQIASFSKDPSTKVGCVLVRDRRIVSTGYNGFPRNISDSLDRLTDRDQKYEMTVHAEVNAITTAALHGVSTEGCSAYVTFNPCSRCAAVLINAGIDSVFIAGNSIVPDRWLQNFILASNMLAEAGVKYSVIATI
ncbi:CMP deaminase [bacterium]|nr:CMP deaminase [bacterium]